MDAKISFQWTDAAIRTYTENAKVYAKQGFATKLGSPLRKAIYVSENLLSIIEHLISEKDAKKESN